MSDKPPETAITGATQKAREDALLDALIGKKLRSYYDELMAEPVPSRILDLLEQLEAKELEAKEQEDRHTNSTPEPQ